MGDYEDTFHPNGTNGDDVEETPSRKGWFDKDVDDKDRKKKGKEKKKGCFLTTAACEHFGFPDDCLELQVLRLFRDNVLCKSYEGNALVDEYYRIAPGLIPYAKEPATASAIWKSVLATVSHIENGHDADAIKTYKEMVRRLQYESRSRSL